MVNRRKFSTEFKREAVAQTQAPGVSVQEVANELGINAKLLSRWRLRMIQDGLKAFGGQGKPRDEEMAQLKRELARVKKERDFLKEAATFFAKES